MDKPNILYCMPRSAGDVLQSTAICKRIKDRFPNSILYFMTSPEFYDLIKDCPWIDHILEFSEKANDIPYLKNLSEFNIVYTPHRYVQYLDVSNWTF